jgi:hypothetical protein
MTKQCRRLGVMLSLVILTSGCKGGGGSSGSSGQPVAAPATVNGRTYDARVTSGTGAFASSGTFRASFATSTYAIQGDGVNVANSNGTYTYSAIGTVGTAIFFDSVAGGPNTLAFSYTSTTSGSYSISSAGIGSQAGTFVER